MLTVSRSPTLCSGTPLARGRPLSAATPWPPTVAVPPGQNNGGGNDAPRRDGAYSFRFRSAAEAFDANFPALPMPVHE
jgi:hypothetical protein